MQKLGLYALGALVILAGCNKTPTPAAAQADVPGAGPVRLRNDAALLIPGDAVGPLAVHLYVAAP